MEMRTNEELSTVSASAAKSFIAKIATVIQKYAKKYNYKVASPIIAQACIESAWGTSSLAYKYYNYFGMKCGSSWKGKSVNLKTKEEYTTGTLTTIKDNFRVYNSMEEGIEGYFKFISSSRYANLKSASTAKQYLERIKADGYATSSTYVTTCMNVVTKYNLKQYDDFSGICPYECPKAAVKAGSKGEGVKWLQWHLNRIIELDIIQADKLDIDGSFGPKTQKVFRIFQTAYPETGTNGKPDGSCSSKSRAKLIALVR